MSGIFHLKGTVKHYDWGGKNFIPALIGVPNPANLPYAEYWLGSHPQDKVLIDLPKSGWSSFRDFLLESDNDLTYLLKILDVDDMLSIQAHPSKQAAEKGFAEENAAAIPIDSPERNFKDENHKQELMVALSEFWLLQGFRNPGKIQQVLSDTPELQHLLVLFEKGGYEGLYSHVMLLPQENVNQVLSPLIKRVVPLYKENKLQKENPDFWAAKASLKFQKQENIDRGIFSIYFLNLINLFPGQGVFQDTGVLHAYLEGKNVEIMSSSDNVLRGGLTNKHIDVKQLLEHLDYEPTEPVIMDGELKEFTGLHYNTISKDFKLTRYILATDEKTDFDAGSTEIILITEGSVELSDGNIVLELRQGSPAAVVKKGRSVRLKALSGSVIFRASSPAD